MRYILVAAGLLMMLNGCSLVAGAAVGAALTPFVQPQVDRILGVAGLDFLDPGGVQAVKTHDEGTK